MKRRWAGASGAAASTARTARRVYFAMMMPQEAGTGSTCVPGHCRRRGTGLPQGPVRGRGQAVAADEVGGRGRRFAIRREYHTLPTEKRRKREEVPYMAWLR